MGERKWTSNVGWSKVGHAVYCLVVKGLCNNNVLKYSSVCLNLSLIYFYSIMYTKRFLHINNAAAEKVILESNHWNPSEISNLAI